MLAKALGDHGINSNLYDRFSENMYAQGYETSQKNYEFVTPFEVIEHFNNPREQILDILNSTEVALFSTQLIPIPTPNINEWEYYGVEHGQHISFYRTESLSRLANQANKYLLSDGKNYHIFSDKRINKLMFYLIFKTRFFWYRVSKLYLNSRTNSDQIEQKKKYENRL